ncbi:MAG: DUF2490 domain-containing protein [Pyrinomonadaceae bacterium MAG19_C2-C3]|nr:DUF2490 domain-containing protein [Pyrinomonadaceae bacterium MAG19_C2-C3]
MLLTSRGDEVLRLCRLMCGGALPHRRCFLKYLRGCASHGRRSRDIYSTPDGKAQPFRTSGGTAASLCKVSNYTRRHLPRTLRFGLCVLLLIQPCIARAQTAPRSDTQSWNDVQLTIPLNRQFDFLISTQFRAGDNLRRFVDERGGFGLNYKPSKYLTLSPSYLYAAMQQSRTQRSHENRLSFAATVTLPKLKAFTLTDRNLFERRLRSFAADATRYRNRVQVEHPARIYDFKFNVVVSDEVFYDSSVRAWSRNRFQIGMNRKLNKHLIGEIYYMRQSDAVTTPGDINVLGTFLRFRL